MSRYRLLKIEGGAFFSTLALADRSSDLLGRVLINSAQCPLRSESDRPVALPRSDAMGQYCCKNIFGSGTKNGFLARRPNWEF
jgi:hypothetical protein